MHSCTNQCRVNEPEPKSDPRPFNRDSFNCSETLFMGCIANCIANIFNGLICVTNYWLQQKSTEKYGVLFRCHDLLACSFNKDLVNDSG